MCGRSRTHREPRERDPRLLVPAIRMVLLAAITYLSGAWRPGIPPVAARLTSGSVRLLSARGKPRMSASHSAAPQLLLVSSGLMTDSLRQSFRRMLRVATADDAEPSIAMLVTASMCGSGSDASSKRSPGELRRRRWADAKKKGREVENALGVRVECVDCAREDLPAEQYMGPLSRAECIWVSGGNTFYLWHWMKRSGADELIKQRVRDDGIVYVGQSAGAIVAGESIRTAFWKGWDDPGAAPEEDWSREENLEAMGLAPTSFFPHYDAEKWSSLVASKKSEVHGRVVCLTDDGEEAYINGDVAAS